MSLNKFREKKGTLTLDILNSGDNSAEMLQVRTENGYYLITLGEIVEDEYQVRTYWDSSKPEVIPPFLTEAISRIRSCVEYAALA
ncbi:DUF6911 family protein [Shimwellia blattae]|uniref:DUF6911 family protein n=1 Tax=Shimwellia blattae TaxID=563 RepID=UPI0039E51AE4